jgi:gas vesicle protein
LDKLADDWTETLRALHGEIDAKLRSNSDALVRHVDELGHEIKDGSQRSESVQKEVVAELRISGGLLGERLEALQENTAKFTGTMESHVKAVSGEVSKLTNKQEETLAVLKEAIRANYDDNAERMKATILEAYDKFLDQIRTIPQALDRYSKLVESLHLNDRLALEGIQTETGNILRLQMEKFAELTSTTGGLTKILPLMDKKFEKQGQILEAMRRSQIGKDKEINALIEVITESRQETLNFAGDVKSELHQIESRTERKFKDQAQMIEATFEQLEKLQQTDLPAFGQELRNLLVSKFEFIESTQADRENARRTELNNRLNQERDNNYKVFLLLGLLGVLSVVMQIGLNIDKLKGLLP